MHSWQTPLHALVTIGILFGAYLVFHDAMTAPLSIPPSTDPVPLSDISEERWVAVTLGDASLRAEVADTPERKRIGLSGRSTLDADTGMLFVFSEEGFYGFWMPDMLISIDIIWLSSDLTVVTVAENVTPETYPEQFFPDAPARYVLEVPAGYSAQHGIVPGIRADIEGL